MKERIRVRFARDTSPLQISHLGEDGIVFAFESSSKPLGFAVGLTPGNPIVAARMDTVRRNNDWASDDFRLKVTRDDDSLVISGGGDRNPDEALPPGPYTLRFAVSETRYQTETVAIDIPANGEVPVLMQEKGLGKRVVVAQRSQWDPKTSAICEHPDSRIDGMDPFSWLGQPQPRIARKACLLNLLAKIRSLPHPSESLSPLIESLRWADVDRISARTRPGFLARIRALPGWRDSGPIHPSHAVNLAHAFGGSPSDYAIESFREPESTRSMQVIAATHRPSGQEVAEFDIDLGNPKIDLTGFFIHVGELLDPGRTNHLSLFESLVTGATSDFLYYTLA